MTKTKNKTKKKKFDDSDDEIEVKLNPNDLGICKSQKKKRKNDLKKKREEMARITCTQTKGFDDKLLEWEGEDQELKAKRKKNLKGVKRVKLNTHNMSIKRSKKCVNHLFYNPKN